MIIPDEVFEEKYKPASKEQEDDLVKSLEEICRKLNKRQNDIIFHKLAEMPVSTFKNLVLALFAKMGFYADTKGSSILPRDIIVMHDSHCLACLYVYLDEKRDSKDVDIVELMAFCGAVTGKSGNKIFVTLRDFRKEAINYAKPLDITLFDAKRLIDELITNEVGVYHKQVYHDCGLDPKYFTDSAEDKT